MSWKKNLRKKQSQKRKPTQVIKIKRWIIQGFRISPIFLVLFGIVLFINPYLYVDNYQGQMTITFGYEDTEIGELEITLTSKGAITANYPIDVDISVRIFDSEMKTAIQNSTVFGFAIANAFQYPLEKDNNGRFFQAKIQINNNTFKGSGTVLFPYPGKEFTGALVVDGFMLMGPATPRRDEGFLFNIESYGLRASIENNNKNLGLGAISLGLTVGSIIWEISDEEE